MAMDGINEAQGGQQIFQTGSKKANLEQLMSKVKIDLKLHEGGTALRKVTQNDINKALNEPNPHKALRQLIANSPVGFGDQASTTRDLENLGYLDTGMRQRHIGAPISYDSKNGGTVTVYDRGFIDKDGQYRTDAGPRTTVYKNGGFEQTMIYDENGKLTGGKIVIKDKVGGFTERQIDFTVTEDGKIATAE